MTPRIQRSFWQTQKLKVQILSRRYFQLFFMLKWLLICSLIALGVGTASAIFLISLEWVGNYRENHAWTLFFLPVGGAAIGFLYYYWGKDVEAGNNLLLENIQTPKKIISFRMSIFVYIGTLVTHIFGGSAGREGTALQMAGGISDQLNHIFRLSPQERSWLIRAAIAAGFGSVFGTPLAGAVFALEVVLVGKISYSAILPVFLAAILADGVTKAWQVPHTHYHIDFVNALSVANLLYALLAGLIFGLCARLFSLSMKKLGSFFKKYIIYAPLRPFFGGIILVVAFWTLGTKQYMGLGIPTIVAAFEVKLPPYDFLMKLIFTVLTLSAGFKGGEVTPLFFIGATLGNALSYVLPLETSLLAGMGFVGVFAGATNTPLACMIMGIELFGIESGVYIALSCVMAYIFSGNSTIYSQQIMKYK